MQKQAHVFYSGTVQGVGFRFTAVALAEKIGINGYVRNLPDGRVEVLAEADQKKVEEFLAQIKKGLSGYISDADVDWADASGTHKDFEVRY